MRLTNEILSDPEDADVKLFCKVLNQLNLCRKNVNTIRDLTELAKQLLEVFFFLFHYFKGFSILFTFS